MGRRQYRVGSWAEDLPMIAVFVVVMLLMVALFGASAIVIGRQREVSRPGSSNSRRAWPRTCRRTSRPT